MSKIVVLLEKIDLKVPERDSKYEDSGVPWGVLLSSGGMGELGSGIHKYSFGLCLSPNEFLK